MKNRCYLLAALIIFLSSPLLAGEGDKVKIETTLGEIIISLDAEKAPATVANFLTYVKNGFYDGTIFHRVIPGFMIQGGGLTKEMNEKRGDAPIKNEADNALKNVKGAVAMARTSDPHSATSQFFINTVENPFLDFRSKDPQGWGYCVFGHVVSGMDVVEKIEKVQTGPYGMHQDVPVEPVVITKASLMAEEKPALKN